MNRNELEHIIRASGDIAKVRRIIILGSQCILGQFPNVTQSLTEANYSEMSLVTESREILLRSIEADIMVPDSEEKTQLVEATIGELSSFHDTYGYYAQGVDRTTSKLAVGWENRLVEICNENTNGISGLCLEIHDLIISKIYAGRKKDIEFFHAAANLGLISRKTLIERLSMTSMSDNRRSIIHKLIVRGFPR